MLNSVTISSVATFPSQQQTFGPLKKINFVFGSNGSGKTTLSRVIANPSNYTPNCSFSWEGNQSQPAYVFNRDFVTKNFDSSSEIKGVFTLGEHNVELIKLIDEETKKINALIENIKGLDSSLNGETGQNVKIAAKDKEIENYCWDEIKTPNDEVFKGAFEGLRNNRAKFKQRVVECFETVIRSTNPENVRSRAELEKEAATIFDKTEVKMEVLEPIDATTISKTLSDPIFSRQIVGSGDVDIAGLIQSVGISDWVKEGHVHMKKTDGKCPFCQQVLPSNFEEKLNQFFDTAYMQSMDALQKSAETLKSVLDGLRLRLAAISSTSNTCFDKANFRLLSSQLESKLRLVEKSIESKLKEPSRAVSLPCLEEELSSINDYLSEVNAQTEKHNHLVEHRSEKKVLLVQEIWMLLIEEHRKRLESLFLEERNLEKGKQGLERTIAQKQTERKECENRRIALQKRQTSIVPTISEINKWLSQFGFTSFKLAPASDVSYKLQRLDGTDVNDTLSEGERSFVTFLYFFQLLFGGASAETVNANRIAVIDDPISSLDSQTLFVVATLVRHCIRKVLKGDGPVKQVIVLTHNIYFHKEISFRPEGDYCFWSVKKDGGSSYIHLEKENPIKTSYELLWKEIQSPKASLVSIQNSMRRILEYYFRVLGGIKPEEIESQFDGPDASICKSLFAWINDGSHYPDDDFHYSVTEETVERYHRVFKRVFEVLKQLNHYEMMIKSTASTTSTSTDQ